MREMVMLSAAVLLLSLVSIGSAEDYAGDLASANGLSCPKAGYMFPDPQNLCFVWYCVYPGSAPIKRACPKGVRVPSWWDGGELNMCFVVNIVKHYGDPICLRCDAHDAAPLTERCASSPCEEGCNCIDTEHTFRCECPEQNGVFVPTEYTPPPVDHCSPNMCMNGASCQNQWDGYFCFCPPGFTGHRCEMSVCDWHPCLNGGTCVVDDVGYHCECSECWTGSCCNVTMPDCSAATQCPQCLTGALCDTYIDSCECRPPQSDNFCQAGSECIETDNGPQCQDCDEPECYEKGCTVRIDTCECSKIPCPTNSQCHNTVINGKATKQCVCDPCWEGPSCNIRKLTCECSNPCPTSSECRDTLRGPTCVCDTCMSGDYCDQPITSCNCNSPCTGNEACSMATGSPQCVCEDSCTFGAGCGQRINSCACNNPCSASQTCSEVNGQLTCGCTDPCMTGADCTQTVQTCACVADSLCNGAQNCIDGNTPFCECKDRCNYGADCGLTYNTCDCVTCGTGQTCTMVGGQATCGCADWCMTGDRCDTRINTCECNNPCGINELCQMGALNTPECACLDPCRYGNGCSQTVDTCECAPCNAKQSCTSNPDGSKNQCVCTDSCDTGADCNGRVQSCECANPCSTGETCSVTTGGQLTCGCDDPCKHGPGCSLTLNTCECNNPCNAGQVCSADGSQGLTCYCANSCMTGTNCDVPVQTCGCNNPCHQNEVCTDGVNGAAPTCSCADSCQYGVGCSQRYQTCECTTCLAGESCSMESGSPVCGCADSCMTGFGCTQRIDSCECQPCAAGEACSMNFGSKQCYCADACYSGTGCVEKINTCECNNPCNAGQECYTDAFNSPRCRCADACKTGANCEQTIQSCACSDPCVGLGTCVNTANGPMCGSCSDSCMTGDLCQDKVMTCQCDNQCASHQECVDSVYGTLCRCPSCYEGPLCSQRINSCACNNQCSDQGTCHESVGGPVCVCQAGWTGARCDQPLNICEFANSCAAYEECTSNIEQNSHTCACPACYTGATCSEKISSCECDNPCRPADLCKETPQGPICQCDCYGREECIVDSITYREECRCPACFYNKPGERGCPSAVINTCECNDCYGEQEVCIDNDDALQNVQCKIGNPSSGHSFTVVFEENHTERSFREIPLEIYFSSAVWDDGNRRVRVRTPGLHPLHFCHIDRYVDVEAGSVYRFPLDRCLRQNGTGLDHLAIRITEINNQSISVYGINKDRWTADGFLALPDEMAGTEFQTSSYSPAHIATQFAIVVLYDDTEVTMTLADDNDLPAPYNVSGAVYTQTFQAFDTFQVQSRCVGVPRTRNCLLDLTGTEIIASKPIHLFSGNVRAWVPDARGKSRDHLIEEILPRDRWGTDFAIVAVPHRVVGDLVQVMAVNGDPTSCLFYKRLITQQTDQEEPVRFSLPVQSTGRYNRIIEAPSGGMYRLKCDKPVFVTHITKSQDQILLYGNETFHDPVTMTIPPISQFTNNFFINTPMYTGGKLLEPKPYETTYALLVAKSGEENSIRLNQQPIVDFVTPWTALPNSLDRADHNLVGAVVVIPHGTNIIRNIQGNNFQCIIYGYDDRESYGFPAAMALGKFRA